RISFDRNLRLGACRLSRPMGPGLGPGQLVGRRMRMIHLVRCLAAQSHVRTELVVPVEEPREMFPEVLTAQGNQYTARAFDFQGFYEAFDHGNAAVLSNLAEPRLDAARLAPVLERRAPELGSFV